MEIPKGEIDKASHENTPPHYHAAYQNKRLRLGVQVVGITKYPHAGHSLSNSSVISMVLVSYSPQRSQNSLSVALVGVQ
jgi:hypothetical protein